MEPNIFENIAGTKSDSRSLGKASEPEINRTLGKGSLSRFLLSWSAMVYEE
jgi:hypothetical protein